MFNRGLYKKNALKCLRDRRPVPTLVSLVVLVTYFLLNAGSVGKSITAVGPHLTLILDARKMNFIVIAIMCFVLGTIEIAEAGFYLFAVDHPQEQLSFNMFIEGFSLFVRGSLAFIWKWLWIFIWGLFFVVPGIIKFFSYSQFFYILRDYPQIGILPFFYWLGLAFHSYCIHFAALDSPIQAGIFCLCLPLFDAKGAYFRCYCSG